jgi:hypothetical protein
MQQAPPQVTQTINRVVQRTIEKVAPDYSPTKVQTVVVKEDELVVDAVAKTQPRFGTLYVPGLGDGSLADVYALGGGFFLGPRGLDGRVTYKVAYGAKKFDTTLLKTSDVGFAILRSTDPAAIEIPKPLFAPDSSIKAGQTLLTVYPSGVVKGLVQSVSQKDEKGEDGKVIFSWHQINMDKVLPLEFDGSILVNLDGALVGVLVPRGESGTLAIGADIVQKVLAESIAQTAKKAQTP